MINISVENPTHVIFLNGQRMYSVLLEKQNNEIGILINNIV